MWGSVGYFHKIRNPMSGIWFLGEPFFIIMHFLCKKGVENPMENGGPFENPFIVLKIAF